MVFQVIQILNQVSVKSIFLLYSGPCHTVYKLYWYEFIFVRSVLLHFFIYLEFFPALEMQKYHLWSSWTYLILSFTACKCWLGAESAETFDLQVRAVCGDYSRMHDLVLAFIRYTLILYKELSDYTSFAA